MVEKMNVNPFTTVDNTAERERLRREIANSLRERLEGDAFYAAHFFKKIKALQATVEEDGTVTEPTLVYELLLEVVGAREADVKRIVGSAVQPVFSFLTEVLASNDSGNGGDSLGE